MLTVISAIIYAAVVLIAVLLIVLVLVQPSKGGGFGSAFGGVGESVFGAQAMGQLSKLTIVLLALFFVLTLALAVLTGHKAASKSLISKETSVAEAPAVPGKDAAASAEQAGETAAASAEQAGETAAASAKQAAAAPVKTPEKKAEPALPAAKTAEKK